MLILYNSRDHTSLIQRDGRETKVLIPGIETTAKRLAVKLGFTELPPQIILGTRSILQRPYKNVGLTVVLSLDHILHETISGDQIHGWADLGHLFNYSAPCLIQAREVNHPLVHALQTGKFSEYVVGVLTKHKELSLPPFGQQIVCSFPAEKADRSEIDRLYTELSHKLQPPWKISQPFTASWHKKPYIHVMLFTESGSHRLPSVLRQILLALPRPWKIQHNPWYLF